MPADADGGGWAAETTLAGGARPWRGDTREATQEREREHRQPSPSFWEHDALHDVAKGLGVHHAPHYESGEYDVIWTVEEGQLTAAHEHC